MNQKLPNRPNPNAPLRTGTQVTRMRCFLTGQWVEPAETQNKVTGLSDVGGHSAGDVISSFDKKALGHYGLSKGGDRGDEYRERQTG